MNDHGPVTLAAAQPPAALVFVLSCLYALGACQPAPDVTRSSAGDRAPPEARESAHDHAAAALPAAALPAAALPAAALPPVADGDARTSGDALAAKGAGGVPTSSTARAERWAPYPPGRWRLAPARALEPVVIWASHILVRHTQALDEESFSFAKWTSVAPTQRTREQALERAKRIAAEARQRPERFAELAREASDDVTNREQGGRLGGLRASQLSFWPQVLDTFAALRPGEVSEPVETRFGFHVFLRQAPPAEEAISGRHIVISHDGSGWSRMTTCKDELPSRTREEAQRLANRIFDALRARPASFADWVQRYSDDCDAAVGGDFGRWSTRDIAPFERRLDTLRTLAPGQMAPPRETHVGFEIIARTPERPRQRLAAELISMRFDPWVSASSPSSRDNALREARAAAEELAQDPGRFGELQRRYCCVGPAVWEEGREPAALRAVLAALRPGEIASEPVRTAGAYLLAKKLGASDVALPTPPLAQLELPSPEHVPVPSLLAALPFDEARATLLEVSRESAVALGLSASVSGQLGSLLADWATTSEPLRLELQQAQLQLALERAHALLGDDAHARYRAALEAGMADRVLSRRLPMF